MKAYGPLLPSQALRQPTYSELPVGHGPYEMEELRAPARERVSWALYNFAETVFSMNMTSLFFAAWLVYDLQRSNTLYATINGSGLGKRSASCQKRIFSAGPSETRSVYIMPRGFDSVSIIDAQPHRYPSVSPVVPINVPPSDRILPAPGPFHTPGRDPCHSLYPENLRGVRIHAGNRV